MNGGRSAESMAMLEINLRKASTHDLAEVNKIIDAAVMNWNLPERVKRLSLPSYHYQAHDLDMLEIVVAETSKGQIVGVAAWEQADPKDTPARQRALLLHGIYVDPEFQRQGVGQVLLKEAEQATRDQGFTGLLVKAQADAAGFFLSQGMQALAIENQSRDYAYRYWKPTSKRRI